MVRYIVYTSQLGQLSLAFLWGREIEYQGKRGNVTSAGWKVKLCDPIWLVSSRSGAVLVSQTACYTLPYLTHGTFYSCDAILVRHVLRFMVVCLSVTRRYCIVTAERIKHRGFCLSHIVLQEENFGVSKIRVFSII